MSEHEDRLEAGSADGDLLSIMPAPVLDLALLRVATCPADDPLVEQLRTLALALARGGGALDLRLARLACCCQQLDLRPLGYGSFRVFVQEELDWQPSRQRALARLLRSDLDLVKRAVACGLVSVTAAARAPGRVGVDQQEAWLAAVASGQAWDPAGADPLDPLDDLARDVVSGDDAVTVRRARQLARLLLGLAAPDRVCDRYILESWAQGQPADTLIQQARTAPAPPDLAPATWCDDVHDLATELVGPWEEPRDLHHALAIIKRVQSARQQRRVILGRVLDQIQMSWLFVDWGHDRFDDWVRAELDLSVRSAQRLRRLGRTLDWHPELAAAVQSGLSPARALAVGRLAETGQQARRWLRLADRLPMRELVDATRTPRVWDRDQLATSYEQTLDQADELVARALALRAARLAASTGAGPTEAGATEAGATGAGATGAGGLALGPADPSCVHIATHPDVPEDQARRTTGLLYIPEGLVEASRWLLATVAPPKQHGCGRIKQRQHYICQNPECRRRSLRNHAHHDHERARGGSDDDDNLRCLCPGCHLRLRHGGFMDVVRVDDAHVYLFPGRAVVVR